MDQWMPPNEYPYADTNPRARCHWLWGHGKAFVRAINGARVERYDCRCGKFYWLSQADGRKPLVRYRTVPPRWGAGAWTDVPPGGLVKPDLDLHGDKGAAAGLIAMAGALVLLAIVVIVAKR